MTTTVNLRKILDRKQVEAVALAPAATGNGIHTAHTRSYRQFQYLLASVSAAWDYLPEEDAWSELPNPGLGGTFAVGACSVCTPFGVGYMTTPGQAGAPLQAVASGAGTTATVVTVNNYGVNALVNFQLRCIAGTAANLGQVRAVASNTATTITTTAFPSATATGDVFALEQINNVVAGAASTATVITAISAVNNQAIGTVGNLVASSLVTYQVRCTQAALASAANQGLVRWITANSTNSVTVGVAFPVAPTLGDVFVIEPYNTVTASGAGTTTTVVTTNAWPINQFSGYQLRPLTGTAANLGQPRLILSNTATTLTLQAALPGATATSDTFVIEPIVFGQELTYSGTATTGGSTTTLPALGTPWVAGQWGDAFQLRIISGTNAGHIRMITNNTASVLTVAAPFPAVPDATTTYIIEPYIEYSRTISIATNQTLMRDLRGFSIRIQSSLTTWDEKVIQANTIGRNAVITVAQGSALSAVPCTAPSITSAVITASGVGTTSTIVTTNSWQVNALVGYQVRPLTGTAGNLGAVRTVVSNTATTLTLSVLLPSATATSDTFELDYVQSAAFSTVTATAPGTATTIVTGSTWAVNAYQGCQIRCLTGTAGNVGFTRNVLSNTATTLTLDFALPVATATTDTFELLVLNGNAITASGAGTTTTVVTTSTWVPNQFTNWQVRALSGTVGNIGCVRQIISNTATTLSTTAFPSATASTDVFVIEPVTSMWQAASYQLRTPRWWIFDAHTAAPVAGQFRYYDYAYNAFFSTAGFSAAATAGVPPVGAAWGTDGRMVSTPSVVDTYAQIFDTFTATAVAAYSITCAARNWGVNQFTNYQARIISGTGAGQVRPIVSNTQTTLSVLTWEVLPDTTSVVVIEGNDDNLYLLGNAAAAMYKFQVSSGAWTLVAPATARSGAPGAAMTAHWAWSTSETAWSDVRNIVSGRRIYSLRGGAATTLDYYDIALNTWVSVVNYAPNVTTFTTGSMSDIVLGRYVYITKEVTNRIYRLDLVKLDLEPVMQFYYPQGTAVGANALFDVTYVDGPTSITWLYLILNSLTITLRVMIV